MRSSPITCPIYDRRIYRERQKKKGSADRRRDDMSGSRVCRLAKIYYFEFERDDKFTNAFVAK